MFNFVFEMLIVLLLTINYHFTHTLALLVVRRRVEGVRLSFHLISIWWISSQTSLHWMKYDIIWLMNRSDSSCLKGNISDNVLTQQCLTCIQSCLALSYLISACGRVSLERSMSLGKARNKGVVMYRLVKEAWPRYYLISLSSSHPCYHANYAAIRLNRRWSAVWINYLYSLIIICTFEKKHSL